MEAQIHLLEHEAYCAVLRAFKAQGDAITWEKEGLITELRKELRLSDDEHRELLSRVNGDYIIQRIREWRQGGGLQLSRFSVSQPFQDVIPSPTVSTSRKKQKMSQVSQTNPGLSSRTSLLYPSTVPSVNRRITNHGSSGALFVSERAETTASVPFIGREVWPEDNNFNEAVISDYNPTEIPPEDIQWDGGVHSAQGRGVRRTMSNGGFVSSARRGRGSVRVQSRRGFQPGFQLAQNVQARRVSDDNELLLHTEFLAKEVERILGIAHPDPFELDKTKRMLKEHEQALVDAIARLADSSDDESDGE